MDVNASETISSSFSLVEQVLMIHDLGYVSKKQHGGHVSKMNMGIKQNYTPSMSSEPHLVGVSPPKETIHGSISWSSAYVDENTTIDLIVNVMTSIEAMFDILQQGRSEGTSSFETSDEVIRNISEDYKCCSKEILNTKVERNRIKTQENEGRY